MRHAERRIYTGDFIAASLERDHVARLAAANSPADFEPQYAVIRRVVANADHQAKDAASQFRAVADVCIANGIKLDVKYEQGGTLAAPELVKQLEGTVNALTMVLSFIKEMSPSDAEDHRYLYEREWRIVSGFLLKGYDAPCKPLNVELKEVLCAHVRNGEKSARQWIRTFKHAFQMRL
jgi:hypothetical protein